MRNVGLLLVVALLVNGCRTVTPPQPAANPFAELEAAIGADASNVPLRYYLATLYARAERSDDAVTLLEAIEKLSPSFTPEPSDFPTLAANDRFRALLLRAAGAKRPTRVEPAFTIRDAAEMIPEGIAWDPASGDFFLGSIRERRIVRIHQHAGRTEVTTFASSPAAPLYAVLGLRVDPARGLLWAASYGTNGMAQKTPEEEGRASLVAFRLTDGSVVATDTLADGKHLLNDIAIADDGTVYVTNSERGTVYRKRALDAPLEELKLSRQLSYPNGIVVTPDQKSLWVASYSRLVLVDRESGEVTPIREAPGVVTGGVDGLYRDGDALVAVRNGIGRAAIVRFTLSADGTTAESETILENAAPSFADVPTTAAIAGDALYVIANSHLGALNDAGELNRAAVRDPEIISIPLR